MTKSQIPGVTFEWPTERPKFATIVDVIDGDTIKLDIDLDLRAAFTGFRFRLSGLNAWEHGTEAGDAAKEHLTQVLPVGKQVVVTTVKDYKYGGEFCGRLFAAVEKDGPMVEIGPWLVKNGWAAAWDGKGERPLAPWPRK